MNTLGQIISLSLYLNKLAMRHQFDFGTSDQHFQFLNKIDEYCHQALANLADNLIIQSNLYDTSDRKIRKQCIKYCYNLWNSYWKHVDKEVCDVIADYHTFYKNIKIMTWWCK